MEAKVKVTTLNTKGNITVKHATVLSILGFVLVAAMPSWAQHGRGFRNTGQNGSRDCSCLEASSIAQPLSDEEANWLLNMREEEKLARDVYLTLYAKWQLRIFDNISASEQRHFDAVGRLIVRYGLADPADPTVGNFVNSELQKLYNDLIIQGAVSVSEALRVGVAIEELDISDLQSAIAVSDNTDILTVYANLLRGSTNHLRAFNRQLQAVDQN